MTAIILALIVFIKNIFISDDEEVNFRTYSFNLFTWIKYIILAFIAISWLFLAYKVEELAHVVVHQKQCINKCNIECKVY